MTQILLKRSATLSKRPVPALLAPGQPAVNYNGGDPGLYFRSLTEGELIKIGPCHVGATAPNAVPPSGGSTGNSKGEFWLDTSSPGDEILKVWNGTAWIEFLSVYDYIPLSTIAAKGDLIVGVSSETPGTLPVGDDGDVLVADSGETLGVKWQAPVTGIPESIIQDKGDLIVGQAAETPAILPTSTDNYVLTVDSTQPLGVRWADPTPVIQTLSVESSPLTPGQTQYLWLHPGCLYTLISAGITPASDGWIRLYTSEAGMLADSRIIPGPPFPSPNSGFIGEVVASPLESTVVFLPVLTIYGESGLFIKYTNLSAITQTSTVEVKAISTIPCGCDIPPYYCNPYVNPFCVTDFSSYPNGVLDGDTPSLVYSGGTTILAEANNSYSDFVTDGSGSLGEFYLDRGAAGQITDLGIYNGSGYVVGDSITILGSLIGGVDGVDDVLITLSSSNGMELGGAWQGCSAIVDFPNINVESGLNFSNAWNSCSNMQTFPALNSGSGLDFSYSWANCSNLTSFGEIDSSSGEDFTNSWSYCTSLASFPSLDFSSATDLTSSWFACTSLTSFPATSFDAGETFTSAWAACTSLATFNPITAPLGTAFNFAWAYCSSLTSFPSLDLSSGLNFSSAWTFCTGLTSFPGTLDVSSGTNFTSSWESCTALTSFPGTLDLSSGTNFTDSWKDCTSLTSFPGTLDLSAGTNFSGSWNTCTSLTSFPATLDLSAGTNFNYSWNNCSGLTSFPGTLDLSAGQSFFASWYGCSSLASFPSTLDLSSGTDFGLAWQGCTLLTSFPGVLDLSSGTDFRGAWADCVGLTSFPGTLDLSSGTVFRNAWSFCSALTSFPSTLDLSAGTDFYGTWSFCSALTSFPVLDLSAGTDFTGAWRDCTSLTSFPAGLFDTCTSTAFQLAWLNCALDQTSVDNILVSLDTAGQSSGIVNISGGTSATPGASGLAAKASLQGKGWTVTTN